MNVMKGCTKNVMKRILIWGTGQLQKLIAEDEINGEVIGYIESNKGSLYYNGKKVYSIENLPEEYDYIIVANTYADEIYKLCRENNINTDKMIFFATAKRMVGLTDKIIIEDILGKRNYGLYSSCVGDIEGTSFKKDLNLYRKLNRRPNFQVNENNLWPVTLERYSKAGTIDNYFWQDLWAARLIYKSGIKEHFDIGSRLDGFIAHLLSMDIDVTQIDIREFPGKVENLHTIVDDATMLKNIPDDSVFSMSALCSLEHFGLGRYGDPIDPEACFRCFNEIQKRMIKGGNLYLSLPIGKERVEFNAHRVFYPSTVVECFSNMALVSFSCTADGKIEYDTDIHKYDSDGHDGNYRYGLFHFKK